MVVANFEARSPASHAVDKLHGAARAQLHFSAALLVASSQNSDWGVELRWWWELELRFWNRAPSPVKLDHKSGRELEPGFAIELN